MIVGAIKETTPGEQRVALVPTVVQTLKRAGLQVVIERGAGALAGYPDCDYASSGAELLDRAGVFAQAEIVVQLHGYGSNPAANQPDLERLRDGQVLVGFHDPLVAPKAMKELAGRGVTVFAMELLPRITRAQGMDTLSSMATIAGYKAVLIAADHLPRIFPMLMTAAGTIAPARVLVIGAGVAGLQAIATAKRLGAVVSGYDIRPAVREQVESLGAKFVELEVKSDGAEDKGGYAKEMGEEFYRRQRELMAAVIAANDVVITTAAIPGKRAPVLVTSEMVKGMTPGSVIVDLAAESGGNCELTKAGETVEAHGVAIIGPANLASTVPFHASQMYSRNVANFILNLIRDNRLMIAREDEITRETLVVLYGEVVHPRVLEALKASA